MMANSFRAAALLAMVFTFGCRPRAAELQVYPERFRYGCQTFINEPVPIEDLCIWEPHLPPPGRMLVDLHFRRKTDMVASEPTARVLPSEISALRAAGGRIDYIFNVPMLRVEIDRDEIPRLVRSPAGIVEWASTPVDLSTRELGVRIFLSRPAQKSDAEVIERLGGRVWAQPDPVNDGRPMMDACVPDSGIPVVEALPGLDYLRPGGVTRCSEYSTFEDGLANRERQTRTPPPPQRFEARLEMPTRVRVGQSVPITLVIQNVHEHTMQLRARIPMPEIVVTARDDSVVWHRFGPRRSLGNVQTWSLAPGEILKFQAEWDQRGNDGRDVPPGTYSVQGGLFFSNLHSFANGSLRIVP